MVRAEGARRKKNGGNDARRRRAPKKMEEMTRAEGARRKKKWRVQEKNKTLRQNKGKMGIFMVFTVILHKTLLLGIGSQHKNS